MNEIKSLSDIGKIKVHWSESSLINDEMGCDENCDIEKEVDPVIFDDLIKRAAKKVGGGYDKTSLSVWAKDGSYIYDECKFYLSSNDSSLLNLLNK